MAAIPGPASPASAGPPAVPADATEPNVVVVEVASPQVAPERVEEPPTLLDRDTPSREFLQDIDDGFDAIMGGEMVIEVGEPSHSGGSESDRAQVEALFRQIAVGHARPLRDFLVELRLGDPPREWLTLVGSASDMLRRSAESMELSDLAAAFGNLHLAVQLAEEVTEPVVGGEARETLLSAYQPLAELFPESFALADEVDRREPIILQSLLLQVPGVRKVALDRLYGAGLTSLGMFYKAKAPDLVEATGLAPDLCQRIVERFVSYRREFTPSADGSPRGPEYTQLTELTATLKEQTEAYERNNDNPDAASEQRRLRRERSDTMNRIQLLLARLGEIERVKTLERLPFGRKIEELEQFLGSRSKV